MSRYTHAIFGALLALSPLQAVEDHFTFTQNMSDHDQEAIGLKDLNIAQQRSLEKWLDLWTIKVVNQVLMMGCECDTSECIHAIFNRIPAETWRKPSRDDRDKTQTPQNPAAPNTFNETNKQPTYLPPQNLDAPQKPWVPDTEKYIKQTTPQPGVPLGQPSLLLEIMQNGAYLKLNDGTLWEVSPTDRGTAGALQPFDQVQLMQSVVPGRFQIIDMTQNQRVEVMKPGTPPAPINPVQLDKNLQPANYFIDNNLDTGQTLVLQNGLVLKIRVGDAVRISRNWPPGTAVQISQVGGAYPYSIRNIQTGDIVQAQLQK